MVVYSGATQAVLYYLVGTPLQNAFGLSVSEAGDVNADGIPDCLVGIPGDSTIVSWAGSAHAYSGADGSLLRVIHGHNRNDKMGWAVGPAGDVNGDGFDDYCVGSRENRADSVTNPFIGYVQVISGYDGSVLHEYLPQEPSETDLWSFLGAGDLNGDGFDDFDIASPAKEVSAFDQGMITAYSGEDASILFQVYGDQNGRFLGFWQWQTKTEPLGNRKLIHPERGKGVQGVALREGRATIAV